MTTASARAAPSAVPLPAQQHVAGGSHGPWRLLSDAAPQEKAELVIGVVGMGDMGRLYVSKFLAGGWQQVHVCDLPSKYDALKHEYAHDPRVTVHEHGALVARKADLLIFSVEAAFLADVVRACGPGMFVPIVHHLIPFPFGSGSGFGIGLLVCAKQSMSHD